MLCIADFEPVQSLTLKFHHFIPFQPAEWNRMPVIPGFLEYELGFNFSVEIFSCSWSVQQLNPPRCEAEVFN